MSEVPHKLGKTWYADTIATPTYPGLEGDLEADIAIIGAGFTGIGAALELAQQGRSVMVLEAGYIGDGASGRNGGQVHMGQRLDPETLTSIMGADAARALWDLAEDARQNLIQDLLGRLKIDCDYRPGVLHAWHRARFEAGDRAYAEFVHKTFGHDQFDFFDHRHMATELGTDVYCGGMLDHGGGHLNPLKLLFGMAEAALAHGAQILTQSAVHKIEPHGDGHRLRTTTGSVRANHVLLCGNGMMEGLDARIDKHVLPLNNYIVTTEPLDRNTRPHFPFAVADSRHVVNYFRMTPDHRLLFGGGETGVGHTPKNIADFVRHNLSKIYPQLSHTPISHAWGGTLAVTLTRAPFVRRLAPNLWTAAGYSGQGVMLAPYFGKLMGRAIVKGDGGFELLSQLPVPAFFGGRVLRRASLAAGLSYYALLDRL